MHHHFSLKISYAIRSVCTSIHDRYERSRMYEYTCICGSAQRKRKHVARTHHTHTQPFVSWKTFDVRISISRHQISAALTETVRKKNETKTDRGRCARWSEISPLGWLPPPPSFSVSHPLIFATDTEWTLPVSDKCVRAPFISSCCSCCARNDITEFNK